jgi:hypothetical protein
MNVTTRWTTNSGFRSCTYELDGGQRTLTRDGERIADHVTHASDLRLGGMPIVFYGRGSSVMTGTALTFAECAS